MSKKKKKIFQKLKEIFRIPADVTFLLGDVIDNRTNLIDDDAKLLARKLFFLYLSTIPTAVIVYIITEKGFTFSIGIGLLPVGIYSSFTGNALLNAGRISLKHWLFVGWKGRIIGLLLIAITIITLVNS